MKNTSVLSLVYNPILFIFLSIFFNILFLSLSWILIKIIVDYIYGFGFIYYDFYENIIWIIYIILILIQAYIYVRIYSIEFNEKKGGVKQYFIFLMIQIITFIPICVVAIVISLLVTNGILGYPL
jgi:hypothetical protein